MLRASDLYENARVQARDPRTMTPAQSARPTDELLSHAPNEIRIVDELRLVDQDAVGPRQRDRDRPRQAHPTPLPPARSAAMACCARGRSSPTTCCAALPSRWRRRSEARQVASPTLGIRTELTGLTDPSRELPVIQTDERIQAAFRLQAPDGRRQRRRGHLARGDRRALEADARERPDVPANRDRFS